MRIGSYWPRLLTRARSFFSAEGPHHAALRRVLEAYVCYRPDVGYVRRGAALFCLIQAQVQGMSYVAAIFLLYMEEFDTFCCMANLLNRPVRTTSSLCAQRVGSD